MRGMLIEKFAGCELLQDEYSDTYVYRVMTHNNICLFETQELVEAYKVAERFSKMYLRITT